MWLKYLGLAAIAALLAACIGVLEFRFRQWLASQPPLTPREEEELNNELQGFANALHDSMARSGF